MEKENTENKKLIVLRIKGKINLAPGVAKTLAELGLKKKYSCAIVDNIPEKIGMLKKIQHCIAYGTVKEDVLKQLLLKRAKKGKKQVKIDEKKIDAFVKEFMQGKAKLKDLGTDKIFALHPPRGGLKKPSRLLWPRGILGPNEKINELIARML